MTRVIAKPVPVKRILLKGLAIVVVVMVMAGGALVWVRYKPALTQPSPAATVAIQPAWGTVSITAGSTAAGTAPARTDVSTAPDGGTAATGAPGGAAARATADSGTETPAKPKTRAKSRSGQEPAARSRSAARAPKSPMTQQSSRPTGN